MNRFMAGKRPRQDEIVALLDASPLPWTNEMLSHYLGLKISRATEIVRAAYTNGRVWRISHGFYTSKRHKHRVLVMVTDELIEKYTGIRL